MAIHFEGVDSAVTEPFESIAGMRCQLGCKEWQADQNSFGVWTIDQRLEKTSLGTLDSTHCFVLSLSVGQPGSRRIKGLSPLM